MQLAARHAVCLTGDTDYTFVERNSPVRFPDAGSIATITTNVLKWCLRRGRKKRSISGSQRQNYSGVVSNAFTAISNGLGISVLNLMLITLGSQSAILLIVKLLFGIFFSTSEDDLQKASFKSGHALFLLLFNLHQKIELRHFKVTSDLLTSALLTHFTPTEQRKFCQKKENQVPLTVCHFYALKLNVKIIRHSLKKFVHRDCPSFPASFCSKNIRNVMAGLFCFCQMIYGFQK